MISWWRGGRPRLPHEPGERRQEPVHLGGLGLRVDKILDRRVKPPLAQRHRDTLGDLGKSGRAELELLGERCRELIARRGAPAHRGRAEGRPFRRASRR